MEIELNDDTLDVFCEWMNNIIEAAIIHGGDAGGAYCCNQKELERHIQILINWLGIKEKVIIYRDAFPKLLLRNKLEEK